MKQGPKLTFLGRRQLVTEMFVFSRQMEKYGHQRVLTKFFLSSVAKFLLENQNEENACRATLAIFPQTNKINIYH